MGNLYKLKRLNVVKIVETENEKEKLIANGFELEEEKVDDKGKK